MDALPAAPARARCAARRGRQPVTARVATRLVLGIDVGGSSIKAGLVDVGSGRVSGQLIAAPTPAPSTPLAVSQMISALAAQLPGSADRVGVAFPSVIKGGSAYTAANIDPSWIG